MDFWNKYVEQSVEQTQALITGMRNVTDVKGLRQMWLESLAQSMDTYLRSPVFLEAMRNNMTAMTQMKQVTEDAARDFTRATGIPRVNDISGLFDRLQIGQEAIMNRLESIEKRLEKLESKSHKESKGKRSHSSD
jgi:hypothetical protein